MKPTTLESARLIRDGGIDAMAALDTALHEAMAELDAVDQQAIKRAFGQVMGEITTNIINPAIAAFPVLKSDENTWAKAAQDRAAARCKPD